METKDEPIEIDCQEVPEEDDDDDDDIIEILDQEISSFVVVNDSSDSDSEISINRTVNAQDLSTRSNTGARHTATKSKKSQSATTTASTATTAAAKMDIDEIVPKDNATIAEQKKNAGNEQYKLKNYQNALRLYSDAISLSPLTPAYYGNRAACLMMIGDYRGALSDSKQATTIDETFEKGFVRIAKCNLMMGDIVGAEQAIKRLTEIAPNTASINLEMDLCKQLRGIQDKVNGSYERKDFRTVVFQMDSALKIAPVCQRYKLLKAECLALLGRIDEANDIAVSAMKIDSSSADAIYVRGLCLYYSDNLDKGLVHFERTLVLDPDHQKAKLMRVKARNVKDKKEKGNDCFKCGKLREAQILYTEALAVDPLNKDINSKLYYNRALVNSRIRSFREAVADCTSALTLNADYLKAVLLRAKSQNDLENYEDCVRDYELALKMKKTMEIKNLLREAKMALKRSKRKDYYKILGIDRNNASDEDIKKAYRKRALVHHPDRHANSTDDEKKEQEKKFKEVGEAYAILSDGQKKALYDSGQNVDDVYPECDPNQMFRQFFRFSTNGNGAGGNEYFFS